MPNTLADEVQTRRSAGRGQKEVPEGALELSGRTSNPLEDLRMQAETAYNSYVDAQRKMARAYRVTERAEVATYKGVEEKANRACDETVEKALAVRAQSEHAAREAYEKAVETAAKAFEETVKQALKDCRQTIQQQWQSTNALSERMWDIFQGKALN